MEQIIFLPLTKVWNGLVQVWQRDLVRHPFKSANILFTNPDASLQKITLKACQLEKVFVENGRNKPNV